MLEPCQLKVSHTNFDYEYQKRILHSILNFLQTKIGGAYVGYADMDNVISSETKWKYPVTLAVLIDFPKRGIS